MSKQGSLDKYFVKRKRNDESDVSMKKHCAENENVIKQSNIIEGELSHGVDNNILSSDVCNQTVEKDPTASEIISIVLSSSIIIFLYV